MRAETSSMKDVFTCVHLSLAAEPGVMCAGRQSATEARDSMSGRRVSSTPSQAYDERPAVARGGSSPAMPAVPKPARRSARGNLDDVLSASAAPDAAGAHACSHRVAVVLRAEEAGHVHLKTLHLGHGLVHEATDPWQQRALLAW